MLNTRKILYWAVTAVCCGLLPFGCVKEDAASLGERHDVAVRLNVGTRAVSETDGTPAGAESAIIRSVSMLSWAVGLRVITLQTT